MKIRTSLHEHWATSSKMSDKHAAKIVETALDCLGTYGLTTITNFDDNRYEKFIDSLDNQNYHLKSINDRIFYLPEFQDLTFIKTQELPLDNKKHVLALGLPFDYQIPSRISLNELSDLSKEKNLIIIADHPFYYQGIGKELNKDSIDKFDAIEVWNGNACFGIPLSPFKRNTNNTSLDFFKKYSNNSFGGITSQDGHSNGEACKSYSIIDKPDYSSSESFMKTLKKSIKEHTKFNQDKTSPFLGWLGAQIHIGKLIGLITLKKFGINLFETNHS
jgi:hypothetical protein